MRDDEAVNLVLHELFEHGRLPRTNSLIERHDEFYDDVAALAGHKGLLHQVNEFLIPQPRAFALADRSARGRVVAWVDGSRACLEKLQREEPDRDWHTVEIAEACGLTALGAGVAILYRATFLQGCRNVGAWSTETGFPERILLAQNIRRPRETLADLIRRHSVLPGGVSAQVASREAESLGNAIAVLNNLESLLAQGVRSPGSVSPQAISSLLADLPDVPAPRPSLEDLRAASRESTLAEYRRRLLRRRRSVSRHDIELFIDCIEETLDDIRDLTGLRPKDNAPIVSVKGPAWDRLGGFVQQLESALGTRAYFGESLNRHLWWGQSSDYIEIVTTDWPASRTRLQALDYESVELPSSPLPSPTTPKGDLPPSPLPASTTPKGEPPELSSWAMPTTGAGDKMKSTKSRSKHDPIHAREEVLAALREWAAQVHEKGARAAYVFGSFVSGQGVEFDPTKSDLDLLVTFPETAASALERAEFVSAFASLTSDLEIRLMRILKTSDADKSIVSINVVTNLELELRIHKGGERSIYDGEFLNLLDAKTGPSRLPGGCSLDHELYRSAIATPKGAQAYRNEFVRSTPNGTRFVTLWVDDDPVPKQLARAASRLQHQVSNKKHDDEYSINSGYQFIEVLVTKRKAGDPVFATLAQKLATRRGGRGVPTPLSPEDQLLMWEILVDEAEDVLRRASSGTSTPVYQSISSALSLPPSDQTFWKTTIEMIVESLQLKHWSWFVDHAVRDLVHGDFFAAADELAGFSIAAIWPSVPESLVAATKALLSSFDAWIRLYGKNAERKPRGGHYGPDNSYRREGFNPRFEQFVEYERQWANRCYWLLCKYIVCLNAFCHEVRQGLDPSFFRVAGNFLLIDSLGVRSDGMPSFYLPTAQEVDAGLQQTPEPTPIPLPQHRDERPRPWPVPSDPTSAQSGTPTKKTAKKTTDKPPATPATPRKRPAGKPEKQKGRGPTPTKAAKKTTDKPPATPRKRPAGKPEKQKGRGPTPTKKAAKKTTDKPPPTRKRPAGKPEKQKGRGPSSRRA